MSRFRKLLGKLPDEATYREVVQDAAEAIGKRTGLDPNSPMANAAKAVGVAGLDMVLDPMNLVPGGPLVKGVTKVVRSVKPLATAVDKLNLAKKAGEAVRFQTGVDKRSIDALKAAIASDRFKKLFPVKE